jgi:DNA mismatch endonuclease, patch repair protein
MADLLTPARRSWNMSRIRSGNTKPEMMVRSLLHSLGYRYRLRRKDLPGKPDLVLPAHRIVVFVHGCFWHRHPGCKNATTPKTNAAFWEKKLSENVDRDGRKQADLERLGWRVITVWECETETSSAELSSILQGRIRGQATEPAHDDLLMVAEKQSPYGGADG